MFPSSNKPLYALQGAAAAAAAFFGQVAYLASTDVVPSSSNLQDEHLSSPWQIEAMIKYQPGTDAMDSCDQPSQSVPSSSAEALCQDMLHRAVTSAAAIECMHTQPAAQLEMQFTYTSLGPLPVGMEGHGVSADDTMTPGEPTSSACEDMAGMLSCYLMVFSKFNPSGITSNAANASSVILFTPSVCASS